MSFLVGSGFGMMRNNAMKKSVISENDTADASHGLIIFVCKAVHS